MSALTKDALLKLAAETPASAGSKTDRLTFDLSTDAGVVNVCLASGMRATVAQLKSVVNKQRKAIYGDAYKPVSGVSNHLKALEDMGYIAARLKGACPVLTEKGRTWAKTCK